LIVGRYLGDEAAVEADDERVVGEGENVSLSEHLFHLVAQYQVMFEQSLHREQVTRLLVTNQIHAPVVATRTSICFICLLQMKYNGTIEKERD